MGLANSIFKILCQHKWESLSLICDCQRYFLGEVISRVKFGWIRSGPGIVAGLPGQESRKWQEIKPRPDQPGPHLILLKRFCFVLRAMNFGCKTNEIDGEVTRRGYKIKGWLVSGYYDWGNHLLKEKSQQRDMRKQEKEVSKEGKDPQPREKNESWAERGTLPPPNWELMMLSQRMMPQFTESVLYLLTVRQGNFKAFLLQKYFLGQIWNFSFLEITDIKS